MAPNNLNLDNFLNKPVDGLLAAIPLFLPSQVKIYGHSASFKARCLAIEYPNKVTLLIYPKRFQFMDPIDVNQVWDFSLFKKETTWHIRLNYEGRGIKDAVAD